MAPGVGAAGCGFPVADADDTAGPRHGFELLVAQVAHVVARTLDTGVRHDDGTRGHGQYVVERLRRRVSEIDEHLLRLHPANELPAGLRQPAPADTVRGSADLVVGEMRRRHHADARREQPIQIVEIAVERVRALDAEPSRRHPRAALTALNEARQLLSGRDHGERAVRRRSRVVSRAA